MIMNRTQSMTDALASDLINEGIGTPRFKIYYVGLWACAIVFGVLFVYDITGSVEGYKLLDIQSIGPLMPFAFGLVPQLVQFILSSFVVRALRIGAKSAVFIGLIWFSAFAIDVGTDYIYLSATSQSWMGKLSAFIVASVFLTVFSDWFLALVLAMLIEATGKMFPGFGKLFSKITGSIGIGETSSQSNNTQIRNSDTESIRQQINNVRTRG